MATYAQESPMPGIGPRRDAAVLDASPRSGVSWGAVFAGAAVAAALTLIMIVLGAGMGLGLASPWEGEGAEAKTISIAGIFWITLPKASERLKPRSAPGSTRCSQSPACAPCA
jgi:hypothetical protein